MLRFQDVWEESEEEEDTGLPTWLEGDSLAPFKRTSDADVEEVCELARVTAEDMVGDIGCGDARVPIWAAARYGARGLGVEIEEWLVERAAGRVEQMGLGELVKLECRDLLQIQAEFLEECTVVFCWLLPEFLGEIEVCSVRAFIVHVID
eukprot:TRINITY_DN17226_c0_g1_i1.p2 TRINITY_DN17226_c0_g1~~TRINITY_DN17226_c0_g1_i1.p2  ORF type:complete len:150 (-),score=41.42 TRINITY_DN17226_c0_g1_i1:492-941(-)